MIDLNLRIPPVILVLITTALMWAVARGFPQFSILEPDGLIAGVPTAAGVVISILGVGAFRRAGTTVNPIKPDSACSLVTSGVYRLSRNPMYLGFLLILSGWAMFLANALSCLLLPAFVLWMNRFQIKPEENALATMFGQQFQAYRSRVRRWI